MSPSFAERYGARSLAGAREDLRAVLELAAMPMSLVDEAGVLLEVNEHLADLLGSGREQLVGMNVEAIMPPAPSGHDAPRGAGFTRADLSRATATLREAVALRADGSELPVQVGWTRVQVRDGFLVVCTFLDVSARADVEAKLRAVARELERSNAELEQFAYVASHDLQEPIRTIINFSEVLQLDHAASLDESGLEALDFVRHAAARMRALVADLLELSRVGKSEGERQRVSLEAVVEEALFNLTDALERSEAVVDRVPLTSESHGVPTEFVRLVQNLLSNAIKFNHGVPHIRIREVIHPRHSVLEISDDGIGIEERFLERIFVALQRLHSVDEFEGTGIGLALCRKIAEQARGTHLGHVGRRAGNDLPRRAAAPIGAGCLNRRPMDARIRRAARA